MRYYNIPIFIPHEGCPHDCLFCNQRKITGVESSVRPEDAVALIREHLSYLPKEHRRVEAAFFGGSFTGLPIELQREFYMAARSFYPSIDGIRLSTRPDYINQDVLALAKDMGVTMIELGAQSASDRVLNANRRLHTFAQTKAAVAMIRDHGIGVGLQMMTGMLGADRETDLYTGVAFAALKPDCVRIYPTLVLKETGLASLYEQGLYQPQTMEEAVETAKDLLMDFRSVDIPVIRLGLHAGEDIQQPGNILAGPFHPAFGELVENRIWRDRMEKQCLDQKTPCVLAVIVSKGEMSKAVGHKGCNREYLRRKYGVELKIIEE